MKLKTVLAAAVSAALLTACGGDVVLQPTNIDNSVDNSVVNPGGGGTDPDPVETLECATGGTVNADNQCEYPASFGGASNPITADLELKSGVHIFSSPLIIGEDGDLAAGEVPTGPTLTIEPGSTLAFATNTDYLSISRGAKIEAAGTADAPIVLTAIKDLEGNAGTEEVSLWGGLVINGLASTNKCAGQDVCNVASEGIPATYGGFTDTDNSGTLEYVIVKHTGFEVAPDNELNGITFNAVGSGTTVSNIQTYSTFDDGIEFFGGSVDITNYVGFFTKDDTIDFSDGYVGNITNALVVQSETDGNRCIEGNNVGSGDTDLLPRSNPTITNFTCITSGTDDGTHGDTEGPIFREGAQFTLTNALIVNPSSLPSNECLELDASAAAIAQAASSTMTDSVIVCSEPAKGALPDGTTVLEWVEGQGNLVVNSDQTASVQALNAYYVADVIIDQFGSAVLTDTSNIGAVQADNDWARDWAFGLENIWWDTLPTDPVAACAEGGALSGNRCTYPSSFGGATNPLTADVTLDGELIHIFSSPIIVGEDGDLAAGEIPTGPTLTIEAGATLAFATNTDYLSISRGAKIDAQGTATNPITLTAIKDLEGEAGPEEVSLWGGLVINGLATTNKCAGQTVCNVASEGIPATYGGFTDDDNSGILQYVIVKHTGFEVAPDNELNGITFNAVGSGTTVSNLQTYSTFDDGIEFFGGSVDITNYVGMFTKDDTIDFSDGYVGNISNALVVQSETDANRCIEGNNVGSGDTDLLPRSNPVISNLTCVTTGADGGTHGDAEGPIFREGAQFSLVDSFIVNPSATVASNECLELDASAAAIAQAGDSSVTNTIIVCSEAVKGTLPNMTTAQDWVLGQTDNVIVEADLASALNGVSIAATIVDGSGTTVVADTTGIGAQTDDLSWAFGLDRIWW